MENNPISQAPQGIDFDAAQGEAFVGLNLLKLEVGQSDGPFLVIELKLKKFGEGSRAKELPQMIGMKGSTPYTMPISASFIARCEDAKLAKGDTFILKRTEDYVSNEGTEGCQSYILKVLSRKAK